MATAPKNTEHEDELDEDGNAKPAAPDPKIPRYRLTEPAYINDTYLEAGQKISFAGRPGHHMVPINAAAKELWKKLYPNGNGYVDPIEAMAQITAPA